MTDVVQRGELVEAELNRMIELRATDMSLANAEDAAEKLAARSRARRYREAVLWQRLEFHRLQLEAHSRTFSRLIDRHKGALRLVEAELGITSNDEGEDAA